MQLTQDPPPIEPVSLADAKAFLRIDHADEDALIQTLIAAARERLETYLNVAFITRTFALAVSEPSDTICLPRWPVVSVDTVLVDGQAASDYSVDLRKRPSTISVQAKAHAEIQFTAGYGLASSDVPAPLRQAILLFIARGYEFRGETDAPMPLMVDALTMPYRVVGL